MKQLLLIILLVTAGFSVALGQANIKGKITDRKGEVLPGANIQIEGTYDGASADEKGEFAFTTDSKGEVVFKITMIGYNPSVKKATLGTGDVRLDFVLEESINALNAVVITAGTFEASDEKKMVMLKPMDIVTTAGGAADIASVMQFLPGANRVGETEGLFVRGGSANETKTVIDGMIVQNPFFSSTPDVPQRGRFTPFMFKGTAFSTGGYSAQYGQALSSVLLLQTQDKISEESNLNLNANLAGLSASYTHKGWINGSLSYTNLSPFLSLLKTNIDFDKVPEAFGASVTINENPTKNSSFKLYGTYTDNQSALRLNSYDEFNSKYLFSMNNRNIFTNASYQVNFDEGKWIFQSGMSYSKNNDRIRMDQTNADRHDERTQGRAVLTRLFGAGKNNSIVFGSEFHAIRVGNIYGGYDVSLKDNYSAVFTESEFYVSPKLAARVGLRGEYTSVIDEFNVAPRLSLAYKVGKYAQFSLAAGRFYQTPDKNYLYLNRNLDYEIADHVILNYQLIKNDRTFRVEAFNKNYRNLITEKTDFFDPNPYRFPTGKTDNSGEGYAKGFDVFFRDKKSVKNADLWVTYSFLDTERKFQNYPSRVTPSFASKHNFSVVSKYFLEKLNTSVGLTYSLTSGRRIYDYGSDLKTYELTKPYENLSFATSYFRAIKNHFVVFYLAVDNVLGRKNVFGYRYSPDGKQRTAVIPPAYRTFFFGVSWSIGKLDRIPKEATLNFD
ncbi:TonB-dependent receptor plug domain-containing protein [Emticicia sp. CRIBPO]|uniref:TonB-dependent receptor n=1 Tax=Emticicia sp. CRIBPO TaxID=2683258 RepID=UPI001411BB69|nr:TonB-dependent receptor [Emticicia sp. CRIBPO]NBA86791.1 TonB-dependent receptor plug domain-containing protein [Emticicia sp. CRIBPO]